jgi:hypothetical protein
MQTHSSHTKHLHIMTYGKLVVLPGAAGLPGCCRGATGCCRVLPGAAGYLPSHRLSWSALPGMAHRGETQKQTSRSNDTYCVNKPTETSCVCFSVLSRSKLQMTPHRAHHPAAPVVRRICEGCNNPRLRLGTAQDSFLGTGWIVVQPIGRRRPARSCVAAEGQNQVV